MSRLQYSTIATVVFTLLSLAAFVSTIFSEKSASATPVVSTSVSSMEPRLVIVDQDASGPGGTDIMSIMAFLKAPNIHVLGITVVSGDQWRDEEVAHVLRILEIMHRTDVPVVPGAIFPMYRTYESTKKDTERYGKATWYGAFGQLHGTSPVLNPIIIPKLPEGMPTAKPSKEDAAHFLVEQVRKYPHQVVVYAGGPLTNIANAMQLDPEFSSLVKELVIMGGSINPQTKDPEFTHSPTREFNFWFDPEAAHQVLTGTWTKVFIVTVDASVQTFFTDALCNKISAFPNSAAQYIKNNSSFKYYMWDELAAIAYIQPDIIKKTEQVYMDVDVSHGPSYGNNLTWADGDQPKVHGSPIEVLTEFDKQKFEEYFIHWMTE